VPGGELDILITDVCGRKVQSLSAKAGNNLSIDVSDLPPGDYILKCIAGTDCYNALFAKE
jgi:hypothetical protein